MSSSADNVPENTTQPGLMAATPAAEIDTGAEMQSDWDEDEWEHLMASIRGDC